MEEIIYRITEIPRVPKCRVCGITIPIIHKVQRTKQYCSRKCQYKASKLK